MSSTVLFFPGAVKPPVPRTVFKPSESDVSLWLKNQIARSPSDTRLYKSGRLDGVLNCFCGDQRRIARPRRPLVTPLEHMGGLGRLKDVLLRRRSEMFSAQFRQPEKARSLPGARISSRTRGSSASTVGWPHCCSKTGNDHPGGILPESLPQRLPPLATY